ncbi:hypothetical protein PACTADRAFT_23431, partial [Pachysolen tannophilus NRRL Y-2460]
LFLWLLVGFFGISSAERYIESSSLLTCMEDSQLTASYFDVKFTPSNNEITFDITAISTISDYVGAQVELIVYGITILTKNITLCTLDYSTLCPITSGHIEISSNYAVSSSVTDDIPSVAYTVPDLDAAIRIIVYSTSNESAPLACVEAILSNGKSVQTKYAAWPIAAVSGLGLLTSGVISIAGHSNTAAHIASNSLSLFIYFQSLAITSMMAVSRVPPIAAAWAQNFVWSMGIIRVGVIQNIANWYVQSTGGTVTSILSSEDILSISVQKRSDNAILNTIKAVNNMAKNRFLTTFSKRSTSSDLGFSDDLDLDDSDLYTTDEKSSDITSKILVLRGIQRVAYLAGIEITSFFLTGFIFFLFFGFIVLVALFAFKAIIEILIRTGAMKEGRYSEYRQHWGAVTKGCLYRLALLALPQLSVLCLWEFTERDSAGTLVIAVCMLIIVIVLLVQAAVRLIIIARNSVNLYKNPAYLLFGEPRILNRFGFLYVQFRADKYFWIIVVLVHTFLKSLFVAVIQSNGKVQAMLVCVLEIAYFAGLCWQKPYMDKRTNIYNIFIATVNVLNAIFYVFFSEIFGQPMVVSSIMAVILFVLNAVFSCVLLIFTIVTCVLAVVYKNPDTRYQPMKDDRVSFIPKAHESEKTDMELSALGATAMRGHD